MDILVLDVGNSYIKGYVYRHSPETQILVDLKIPTPRRFDAIFETCWEIVSGVVNKEGVDLSGVIVSAFSDALVTENDEGETKIIFALDPGQENVSYNLPYTLTGYTSMFPNLYARLRCVHLHDSVRRALPVSAMVAAHLCDNRDWKHWDITHASNSGMWDQVKHRWLTSEYEDIIDPEVVPCSAVVGEVEGIPVLVGGHDALFCCANKCQSYVVTGTWTIASLPQGHFQPDPDAETRVRWLRDPKGCLHKQMNFKTPEVLTDDLYDKVAGFLKSEQKIAVAGAFAHQMSYQLALRGFHTEVREALQHEETALFAMGAFRK